MNDTESVEMIPLHSAETEVKKENVTEDEYNETPVNKENSEFCDLESKIELEEDMVFKTESSDLSEFLQETFKYPSTVDDDNIPYDNWGDEVFVGQEVEIDVYEHKDFIAFDPISPTNHNDLWHRGYPIELVPEKNNIEYKGKGLRKVLIQADFWDGDPDIDALCRLSKMPVCKFDEFKPFGSPDIAPFNSQNTFLAREVLPYYAVLPHAGRMDDIWGAYIVQHYFPRSVVYNKATVYQDRNEQDLITNMENEIIGYRNTLNLIQDLENYYNYLPEASQKFWDVYRKQFN